MSDLGALTADGIGLLIGSLGEATGTLTQDGTANAFTDGVVVRENRRPRQGQSDIRERTLVLLNDGIGVTPVTDSRVAFTGDSTSWTVLEADPISPGGTSVGWVLELTTNTAREG